MPSFRQSLMLDRQCHRHGFWPGTVAVPAGPGAHGSRCRGQAVAARRGRTGVGRAFEGKGYEPATYPTNARGDACGSAAGSGARRGPELVSAGAVERLVDLQRQGAPVVGPAATGRRAAADGASAEARRPSNLLRLVPAKKSRPSPRRAAGGRRALRNHPGGTHDISPPACPAGRPASAAAPCSRNRRRRRLSLGLAALP